MGGVGAELVGVVEVRVEVTGAHVAQDFAEFGGDALGQGDRVAAADA